jgi:hypothetical protein
MTLLRALFFPALVIALVAGMTACGGDDAPSDGDYFRKMDDLDKEVDKRFEDVKCDETTTARQCATSFGDGVSFAETKYVEVKPAKSAEKEHQELVAALKELREKLGTRSFQDSDPVDAVFESGVLDTTRVDNAFCAIQRLADDRKIKADVGCPEQPQQTNGPSAVPP